ncbi:monooxygenase [Erysipelothrix urinaevulpis]|uniref:monooxygenase n=1 Tax=Erysipelothrix urinaevulpis TaxID=2683717 RepID=UPI00135A9DD0|nr:monooxygenase [Erysipelothrix urinaevulpis]
MPVILQMHFDKEGPFGEDYVPLGKDRAESINHEPGFIWKLWTENPDEKLAGGIYLFDTKENAQNYADMHLNRLKSLGFKNFETHIFEINETLSDINSGPYKV